MSRPTAAKPADSPHHKCLKDIYFGVSGCSTAVIPCPPDTDGPYAAVEAALVAALEHFPEGSIKNVTAEMDWSYRWMEKREVRFSRDDDGGADQG